jgi:hypothetical protein
LRRRYKTGPIAALGLRFVPTAQPFDAIRVISFHHLDGVHRAGPRLIAPTPTQSTRLNLTMPRISTVLTVIVE